jgi:hypothetical protein
VDREDSGGAQRLKNIDAQAARLDARRLVDPKQLIAKCLFFSRQRLKMDDEVNRQRTPPN